MIGPMSEVLWYFVRMWTVAFVLENSMDARELFAMMKKESTCYNSYEIFLIFFVHSDLLLQAISWIMKISWGVKTILLTPIQILEKTDIPISYIATSLYYLHYFLSTSRQNRTPRNEDLLQKGKVSPFPISPFVLWFVS